MWRHGTSQALYAGLYLLVVADPPNNLWDSHRIHWLVYYWYIQSACLHVHFSVVASYYWYIQSACLHVHFSVVASYYWYIQSACLHVHFSVVASYYWYIQSACLHVHFSVVASYYWYIQSACLHVHFSVVARVSLCQVSPECQSCKWLVLLCQSPSCVGRKNFARGLCVSCLLQVILGCIRQYLFHMGAYVSTCFTWVHTSVPVWHGCIHQYLFGMGAYVSTCLAWVHTSVPVWHGCIRQYLFGMGAVTS